MKQAKQKLGKSGGFTLVEMLIVVAIIAILIAVSIPLISSSLEKARHAVDRANERDALALASVKYLTEDADFENLTEGKIVWYAYCIDPDNKTQGYLDKNDANNAKGQCTGIETALGGTACTDDEKEASGKNLYVGVDADGKAQIKWAEKIPT